MNKMFLPWLLDHLIIQSTLWQRGTKKLISRKSCLNLEKSSSFCTPEGQTQSTTTEAAQRFFVFWLLEVLPPLTPQFFLFINKTPGIFLIPSSGYIFPKDLVGPLSGLLMDIELTCPKYWHTYSLVPIRRTGSINRHSSFIQPYIFTKI